MTFLLLLMFVISTAVPSLVLSADVAERQRAQDQERLLLRELKSSSWKHAGGPSIYISPVGATCQERGGLGSGV